MSNLLMIAIVIASLFVAGQWYLQSRRRKARGLLERLAGRLGMARRGNCIHLMAGSHRVRLDAQVTRDDRPEELRLTLRSTLPGDFRLTRPVTAPHYDDCSHRKPAAPGTPFAGWHVHSEYPDQLAALASDQRVVQLLDELAALGFTRVELAKSRLSALWPDFSWQTADHRWEDGESNALPDRVQRAAARLSALATAAESALHLAGFALHGPRVQTTLTTLLLTPLALMIAGIVAILTIYDSYPTVSDGELLSLMTLAGVLLTLLYTAIAYRLLQRSIQRGARTTVVALVAFFGFWLGSAGPLIWWNGSGPQGDPQRVTVEVVRLQQVSALDSGRGRLLWLLIGEETPLEEWAMSYRAIVRSWRNDSLYGIKLQAEQFAPFPPDDLHLSLTVYPGALGLEWYAEVRVVGRHTQDKPRGK